MFIDFKECLPLVEKSIFEATFVAVDAEFTGKDLKLDLLVFLITLILLQSKLKKVLHLPHVIYYWVCGIFNHWYEVFLEFLCVN